MQNDIEHEFLQLNDFDPNAAARFPPSVRIKTRVAFSLNRDTCRMTFHFSIEYPTHASGVIPGGHEHNGAELLLVAPWRKNLTFTFGSSFGSGNLHDIRYAKPSELADLPCRQILVGEPAADELEIFSARRVRKNRNSRRDAAMHEVRRL